MNPVKKAWRYTLFVHIQISIMADQELDSTSRTSHKQGSRSSTSSFGSMHLRSFRGERKDCVIFRTSNQKRPSVQRLPPKVLNMPRKGFRCRITLRPKGCQDNAPRTVSEIVTGLSPIPLYRVQKIPNGLPGDGSKVIQHRVVFRK